MFRNVIIPLSAWRLVRQRNRKAFARLQDLHTSTPNNFFVFDNEFFSETLPSGPLKQADGYFDAFWIMPCVFSENVLIAHMANYLLKHWRELKVVPLVLTESEGQMKAIQENYTYTTTFLNYCKGG